ncbi:hypothetical protein PL11201_1350002 [Planktothrix sp. PCC 11201]|uniref:hypothetical protein n=1 Tax=Planktothrix sp. PCC 11201 TaxID=1729650 RepID=UPI00091019FA|nr:hypothetical protein [Planktothrix sp. PCC 11201]SKB11421.1 hypothetical protein PL11201_1350002 [Planktothrix sp. PCC 11201]
MPQLYSNNPPTTFESLYSLSLFRSAQNLADSNYPSFDSLYAQTRKTHNIVCLGLYGCNDTTLNMQWRVESLHSAGFWIATTLELADMVTLAMRLSGKSDHYINVSPSDAFEQSKGNDENNITREPLLIRTKDDILFCDPQVRESYCCDAYFLDCEQQNIQRLGLNGGDAVPTLKAWGVNPQDDRLRFLFG